MKKSLKLVQRIEPSLKAILNTRPAADYVVPVDPDGNRFCVVEKT